LAQSEVAFNRAHQDLVAAVVMAVAGHRAIELDSVRQQVYVFVLCVGVARDDVLVGVQPHAIQVAPANSVH
jgi:hypothetical protein